MPRQRQALGTADLEHYHISIGQELERSHLRFRHLVGDRHYGEDGGHRETVIRKLLRQHMPDEFLIGKGFVRYQNDLSTEIDILIVRRDHPTLYKEGEVMVVTPDAVAAIIEVKTKRNVTLLKKDFAKLSQNIKNIRGQGNLGCWAGYIALEGGGSSRSFQAQVDALKTATEENVHAAINTVSLGMRRFIRFWPRGEEPPTGRVHHHPYWQGYNLPAYLAPSYFVGNCIDGCTQVITSRNQTAWFSVNHPHGKEAYRHGCAELNDENSQITDSVSNISLTMEPCDEP